MDETDETKPLLQKLCFNVQSSIALRESPKLDAERTGEVLLAGDSIVAHDIVTVSGDEETHWDHIPLDEPCFIDIGDERGWALNKNLAKETFTLMQIRDDDTTIGTYRGTLRAGFQTRAYDLIIAGIIILNALAIWAEIDHADQMPKWFWAVTNSLWGVIYVIEISMKIFAFGWHFFGSKWNVFDFIVTGVTILSDVLASLLPTLSTLAPVFRLLRLLRLTNVFAGLRTLMVSFTSSLGALMWISVFIGIWFFISGCLTTVLIGRKEFFPDTMCKNAPHLRALFKDVPQSMYTLWEVMSMEGWIEVVRPISMSSPVLVSFFFLFIFVSGFFLMNLVTAVVVDRTLAAQQAEEDACSAMDQDENVATIYNLMKKFQSRNEGKELVSRKDLGNWLKDSEVNDSLKQVDWDPELAERICSVIDRENTGNVTLPELQQEINNTSRTLDTMSLVRAVAELASKMERQEQLLQRLVPGDVKKPAA